MTSARRFLLLALATVACALMLAPAASAARRSVPFGWMGTSADTRLISTKSSLTSEGRRMTRSGVESIRPVFSWPSLQPYERLSDVPAAQRSRFKVVDGIPTDFTHTDEVVRRAALQNLSVLPVVTHTPRWAAYAPQRGESSPPRDTFEYARYLRALVSRYGASGDFWAANPTIPRRPLRHWQIWNEPHIGNQWAKQPYVTEYVQMLRQSRAAARSVDGGARIVLAGLANRNWIELARIIRAGGGRSFDIAAAHIYTRKPSNLLIVLRRFRRVLVRAGYRRKPVWLTEFGWASRRGRRGAVPWEVSDRTAAKYTGEAFRLLARKRRALRLGRAYWYTWLSEDSSPSMWEKRTGLRRVRGGGRIENKRPLGAYVRMARKLEGCRKRWSSTRCR